MNVLGLPDENIIDIMDLADTDYIGTGTVIQLTENGEVLDELTAIVVGDLDGDGLQGMDEPGIPNVIVELVRDGSVLAEAVSDQYGFYRFEDIYPGVYTLRVTPPSEVRPTKRRTDIRIIASVLGEEGDTSFETTEIQVESDKANYNADRFFICRRDGVLPPGTGEGKTQDWTGLAGSDR